MPLPLQSLAVAAALAQRRKLYVITRLISPTYQAVASFWRQAKDELVPKNYGFFAFAD
jgi:hypothetical protein